jgi:hypothetical protein
MGKAHRVITKIHRIAAGLFLLAMMPAGYVSFTGNAESPLVYLPLPFLFVLVPTGTYQLVLPWIRGYRARRLPHGDVEASTES